MTTTHTIAPEFVHYETAVARASADYVERGEIVERVETRGYGFFAVHTPRAVHTHEWEHGHGSSWVTSHYDIELDSGSVTVNIRRGLQGVWGNSALWDDSIEQIGATPETLYMDYCVACIIARELVALEGSPDISTALETIGMDCACED